MANKTVLITGATGQLGRQCLRGFENSNWKVIGTGFSRAKPPQIHKLDLVDSAAVNALLDETKPRAVVHCAAERSPDRCSQDPEGTLRLNVAATSALASACHARNVLLIYISTDYVFSGRSGEAPYETSAPTSPPNFYGESKQRGEEVVLENNGIILRVPVLYGDVEYNGESAVNVLVDAVLNKDGKERVEMDHWSIRYPTCTEDVARVVKDVVEKYTTVEEPGQLPKILQFSSEDRMTKFEICKVLAEVLAVPLDHMVGNDTNDPNAKVQRPYDCHLSTKALKDIGIDVSTMDFRAWWRRYLGAYRK